MSIDELKAYRGPLGLGIERDLHFEATQTLSEYAAEAERFGRVQA